MPVTEGTARRQCIPIIYTRGTHYEVGYDVGRTFASIIQNYVKIHRGLNDKYLPAYFTTTGRQVYDETLASVKQNFPQYVRELEGTADGSKVPFHKLFLLHLDNITTNVCRREGNVEPVGCSSICVNSHDEVLGHTEDALSETLNHFYFVSAHIITDKPQGKWGVMEEKFTSLCYAGLLPGYTMNYNHHGLVFSINTLCAAKLLSGKTPRHFISRALLAAENFVQAQEILTDQGCGAADGCSINMTFLQQEGDRMFHNFEMGPDETASRSQLNGLTISPGEYMMHCNKYLRLGIPQTSDPIIKSSEERMEALKEYPMPNIQENVAEMLGDESGLEYRVFQDISPEDIVKTIAVGIFNCKERTWSIYADNPRRNEPLVVLPLILKKRTKIV